MATSSNVCRSDRSSDLASDDKMNNTRLVIWSCMAVGAIIELSMAIVFTVA